MKKFIILVLFLVNGLSVSCQESLISASSRPGNSINLNLLGRASSVTLTYERLFPVSEFFLIATDFGGGYGKEIELGIDSTGTNKPPTYLAIPHQVSFNIGKGRSFLEAGIGGTAIIGNVYPHYIWFPVVGYRFQPLSSGNMKVRLYGNFLTVNTDNFRNIFFTPFGLSLGYCF